MVAPFYETLFCRVLAVLRLEDCYYYLLCLYRNEAHWLLFALLCYYLLCFVIICYPATAAAPQEANPRKAVGTGRTYLEQSMVVANIVVCLSEV